MDVIKYRMSKLNIVLRKDGRYHASITDNGKRKDFYGRTKTEVKQKAKEYLVDLANGYFVPERITLSEYMEYWLKQYKWSYVEPTTYTRLYRTYETQIKDSLGNYMIGSITTEMIQELINEHAYPKTKETKALAVSGLKKILQQLNACYNKAVDQGILPKNPCEGVQIPVASCVLVETKEQFSMNADEIEDFKRVVFTRYKSSKEYRSRDAFVLLIMMNLGLRVGEALALEWADIDLTNKKVRITKTVQSNVMQEKENSSQVMTRVKKSTKTTAGVRTLVLNDKVIEYIQELKAYDRRNHIRSPYFCSTAVGTRNTARNLQRSLDRLVAASDISRHVTLHTLRHTFGSTMLRKGVPIEVVSKLMGHSNITITYNKYIHVLQEQQAEAMAGVFVC